MNDIAQMLKLMDRPAFCAEDGRITAVNEAARARQFSVGDPVSELLIGGQEEYREFRDGCLFLQLRCCGEVYGAAVTALSGRHIFALEPEDSNAELRLLSLAAQTIRDPLGNVMALVESLPTDASADTVARIERSLYQLLRIVGNMTLPPAPRPEMQDITELFRELCEKVRPAFESSGVALHCTLPPVPVYSCADPELLTRAVHNLISNSLKHTPEGGTVRLELKLLSRSYQILLRDSGDAVWPMADPFTRYRREPGIGDGREGLGLGMKLVRLAAAAHGGTVLLTAPKDGGLQTALTLPIRQDAPLRSPRLRVSYTGERDPMLIELSDVLPPEFYKV